jgi:hypothetical protein
MFDIFYYGEKPNLFAFEKPAVDLADAARQAKTGFFWYIYGGNDYTGFNFDYTPVPWQAHFTHVWGDQHNIDGNVYLTNNPAAQHHYHDETKVHRLPNIDYFVVPDNIDQSSIDWRWSPNPNDPPYIYHFPSQHQSASGVTYCVPGATDIKLVDDFVVRAIELEHTRDTFWHMHYLIETFDFSWHPNPLDPACNYVWGNQWYPGEIDPTIEYRVDGATETKYMQERVTMLGPFDAWELKDDVSEFDYSWHPNPVDPPYIYAFGNQWMPPEVRVSAVYAVSGATEIKYMHEPKAYRRGDPSKFITNYNCVFDYSWEPDPGSPPYNYVWGNQWWPAEKMPTVEYRMAGATETKYMDQPCAKLLPNKTNWVSNADVPFDFDYSWCPDPGDPPYIYVFGNQHWEGSRSSTVEYHVPGATEHKFVENVRAELGDLEIFFVNKSNPLAQSRMSGLKDLGVNITTTRYANSMLDTIKRCAAKSKTNLFWVITSENDYSEFDFKWQPEPWQRYMTHVFGSKWNKWTDTFLINKYEFERHIKWATALEQFPSLNFVTNQLVTTADDSSAMYYIDHGNEEARFELPNLQKKYPNIRSTRFVDNYLDTFKRIIATATTDYVWVLSSVCDYSDFDFTWQPGAWEREQIHCFCNNKGEWNEKRGDTFYIPVEVFKSQMYDLAMLDWFNVISYNASQQVTRWNIPVVEYNSDNLIEEIKNYNFTTPYVLFANREFAAEQGENIVDCLWTEKDRTVRPYSLSGGITLVPRDAKKYLKTQMYDYPYLYKYDDKLPYNYYADNSIDIVYISNGEPDAERWYEHLVKVLDQRHVVADFPRFSNRLHRVSNVNGRVAAYQAAARVSTTHWFFAVFAKLEVDMDFDFRWQPDYWQEPKHYIFNAKNPVNGLEYGHMGMIAYNKRLVLENNNPGIDFTLSQPHESVPKLSGVAHFNQDAWTTWRTAFREVLKLRMFMDTNPTLETEHRLDVWCNEATGMYSNYSKQGAQDAIAYYDEVAGDPEKLQLSFDWAWLRTRFDK